MIRVTINDEPNIQEFITYFVKEKRILRVQDNIYDYELSLSNIIKIEKRVKDLTIEECEQLGIYVNYYGQICKIDGIEWEFDLLEEKIINISKYDYIDITDLIKE